MKGKRNGLTITDFLPIYAAFAAKLKITLPQCNAIGVRTPPVFKQIIRKLTFSRVLLIRTQCKLNNEMNKYKRFKESNFIPRAKI